MLYAFLAVFSYHSRLGFARTHRCTLDPRKNNAWIMDRVHLVIWICFYNKLFTASTSILLAKSQKLKHRSFQDQAKCQNAMIFTWPSHTWLDDGKATGKHGKVVSTNRINCIALLKRNDPTVEKFGAGLRPPSRLWQNATCNSVNPTSSYFSKLFHNISSTQVPFPKMSSRQQIQLNNYIHYITYIYIYIY